MELPSGHDKFVMALADFISDPSLSTPLTIGLYSRWSTGKSIILQRIYGELFGNVNIPDFGGLYT